MYFKSLIKFVLGLQPYFFAKDISKIFLGVPIKFLLTYLICNLTPIILHRINANFLIVFSIPVTTRKKNRKANADDLLTWLTDESANGHFSKEPDESGMMYLIDEKGQLQGAFEMNTIWNRQFMKIIFQ